MHVKRITSLDKEHYQIIGSYHKDHITYNFPDSLYNEALFKAQLVKDIKSTRAHLFFALDDQENVVGFLWLRIETDAYKAPKPYRYLDLHYIHVDGHIRSKGVGSALMEFTLQFAKKKHCKEIRLGTHIHNTHAQNLYKKFGFKDYRIIMRKLLT